MKLNKMTLAAIVTFGVMAGTNAGFTQEATTEMSNDILAACPLSGCPSPVTPQTAKCPKCLNDIDSCTCQSKTTCDPCETEKKSCDTCKPLSDDCNPCPPIAQCPAPSDPTCAVCPQPSDAKKFQQQVYAYPNAIYGNNQVVGERNNGIYLGDDSMATMQGIPVAEAPCASPATACGCEDGTTTGAAASIPCLDNTPMMSGIPVDRNPQNIEGCGCPVQIHTNTSMDVMKKTIEPFEYSAMTGGAAPIVSAFEDVPDGYWASCDINILTENNVIAGYPDRTFKPNLPVSRAEMATLVVKGFNLNDNASCPTDLFKDVPESHWANKTIAKAVSNGIMSGYPNNMFKPDQPISRAEAFAIMAPHLTESLKSTAVLFKCIKSRVSSGDLTYLPPSDSISTT